MVASDNAGARKCSNGAVTVLVVEDETLILDMISQELTEQGFAVLEAETGEATVSLIKSGQTVDVLFTDIRLPGELDGWRLAATARQAKPELPVIYVTDPAPVKTAIDCLRSALRVSRPTPFNLALLLQRNNEHAEAAKYWPCYLDYDTQPKGSTGASVSSPTGQPVLGPRRLSPRQCDQRAVPKDRTGVAGKND